MSYVDITEYNSCVLKDGETVAFFYFNSHAEMFLDFIKKKEPDAEWEIGEYIDVDVTVYVRGSY
jgi:hypothetical protein